MHRSENKTFGLYFLSNITNACLVIYIFFNLSFFSLLFFFFFNSFFFTLFLFSLKQYIHFPYLFTYFRIIRILNASGLMDFMQMEYSHVGVQHKGSMDVFKVMESFPTVWPRDTLYRNLCYKGCVTITSRKVRTISVLNSLPLSTRWIYYFMFYLTTHSTHF